MSEQQYKRIIGGALLAGGIAWATLSWGLRWRRNNVPRITDKKTPKGYYYVEGVLQSNNPVFHNGVKYAKLVVKTGQSVQIVHDSTLSYASSATSTTMTQCNVGQVLTIGAVDVTEFIDQFPLITIMENHEADQYIYGLPVEQGQWRISGWFDGEQTLKKIRGSRIDYELGSETRTESSLISTSLLIVGTVLLLDSFMSE